jgi:hypothetical protein
MTEKFVNHYGKWVGSETAITGVLNTNQIAWEWVNDEICLTCEYAINEIENDIDMDEDEKQSELEFIECDSSHTRLLGDWIFQDDKEYVPDESGEFAAIENEFTVQVIWSKYTTRGALCSPCYPGQVDLGSDGEFLAYTLPDYLLYKDE